MGAWLYSSTYDNGGQPGGTLNGNAVNYSTALGLATSSNLQAYRADVTSIVAGVINGGAGGIYNFDLTESGFNIDGEALVVVFSNAALPTATIGILDGFTNPLGDSSSITFAAGLNTLDPGFFAEMSLGIGFSCCESQFSTVDVNGQRLTNVAGNFDDGLDFANGSLITVGGFDDPFTVASPGTPADGYYDDHERYNLAPFIANGSTQINLTTTNPSDNDNIFLQTLYVTGEGVVTGGAIPEPATWAMMLMGFGGLGAVLRRRRSQVAFAAA